MAMAKRRFKSQVELFRYVWEHSDKKSAISGEDLNHYNGTPFFMNCFAHVLHKSVYTKYKYNPENIILLSPREHWYVDFGTHKQRREYEKQHNYSFDVFYNKKKELLKRYPEID